MRFHSQSQDARERDAQGEAERELDAVSKQFVWDKYWLGVAFAVARKSKDRTKIGTVIVRPDNSIVSTGFNGFPRGLSDAKELYEDRDVKLSRTIHSEVNAIQFAREKLDGYAMYTTFLPCDKCALQIIQAGIKRVITILPEAKLEARWKDSFTITRALFSEANVHAVLFHPETLTL